MLILTAIKGYERSKGDTITMSMFRQIAVVCSFALTIMIFTGSAQAQTATISGKLIDRVCSVEDVYQLQPSTEKRCTLWIEATISCLSAPCSKAVYTVYCPNAAVDGRPFNGAYELCSDPYAMQIRHPTKTYIIQAFLRTVAQQADGYGQFTGYQFQY